MPRTRPRTSKHWIFTINNPTDADKLTPAQKADIMYIIVNREVGDEGTPHWQGYVCFKKRIRQAVVKRYMPRAHLEIKRGSVAQAIHYCMKPVPDCECEHCEHARPQVADWIEFGTKPLNKEEGTKQKWADVRRHATEGNFDEIPDDVFVRCYHQIKRIRQDNPTKPADLNQKRNEWIVGPSGVGKSTYARAKYPDFYDKAPNKWFVGYQGQTTILLDDIGRDQCKYLSWYIKRWSDVFAFPIETKGGGMNIRPDHIVVTSQYEIEDCFEDHQTVEAVLNRFEVTHLDHWITRMEVPANPQDLD